MTEDQLRALYGAAGDKAAAKVITRLDRHCRAFIAHAPFVLLATSDGDSLDVSPKGDAPGFVVVRDDQTLLIPDRPGNNRIDGLLNIVRNPAMALLFMIPAVGETLRVNGHAEVTSDPALCSQFPVNGRVPVTVTIVTVREAFVHCGKALVRSRLWQPASWPAERPVAGLGDMIHDHTGGMDVPYKTEPDVQKLYRDTLY